MPGLSFRARFSETRSSVLLDLRSNRSAPDELEQMSLFMATALTVGIPCRTPLQTLRAHVLRRLTESDSESVIGTIGVATTELHPGMQIG